MLKYIPPEGGEVGSGAPQAARGLRPINPALVHGTMGGAVKSLLDGVRDGSLLKLLEESYSKLARQA